MTSQHQLTISDDRLERASSRQGRGRFSLSRLIYSAKNEQLQYLSQSVRLDESLSPRLTKLTALSIGLSVLAFIGWASITNINEIARASGEVVPIGFEQTIQHLDGGIVRDILVQDGDVVEQGQLLLNLNGVGAIEDQRRMEERKKALEVKAERLNAFLAGRKPIFNQQGEGVDKAIVEQSDAYRAMLLARSQQSAIVSKQITQKEHELSILRARKTTIAENLKTLKDLQGRYQTLYDKGHLSYVRLAETTQRLTSLRGERATLDGQIRQASVAIDEFNERLGSLEAIQRDEAYRELHEVEAEIAQTRELLAKAEQRVERLSVRSPVQGIVKGLSINTIGGVVQPGQTLMSVLPIGNELVVEAKIPPRDIGHVHVGQNVLVKVSAYDFARYGALRGTLDFISAATFKSDGSERFYRGRVKLEKAHMGESAMDEPILPGMTVTAEIVTGEKTILDYLLKPVHQAVTTALSER